ncbi:MAG: Asparagine synthetase [Candidatus Jorgensenbacteria bacterium GW2011_GWF2_41_8]|uniref:asparagine synthase (glutamine-hydrolyzing) n=1 Tax=Candidatus Jorgensenbacteria bacterium GW2011_GWF2_41_8 TaxID=1618667 RepID=A0A0G1AI62_9BACT|nr:MAG: Asparagine synthetase [Candidatus Jorgensenbacteria bacterium GW2011_GWF2_41_8]
MCAINGFNFKDEGLILKMNQATRHRGPDGTGIFLGEKISLGHNRLSIIDLSDAANQPMFSSDGNLVISFNGEIYNFREIKREFEDFYKFKTNSDTEVILAAYQKWGAEFVKKLQN